MNRVWKDRREAKNHSQTEDRVKATAEGVWAKYQKERGGGGEEEERWWRGKLRRVWRHKRQSECNSGWATSNKVGTMGDGPLAGVRNSQDSAAARGKAGGRLHDPMMERFAAKAIKRCGHVGKHWPGAQRRREDGLVWH